MTIRPITIREADAFVTKYHRHNKAAANGKFAISAWANEIMVGVAISGRPRSRHLDDGKTLEVYRVCTDGTPNSCSFLYARVVKIARAMGYENVITYSLQSESGSSLKAIGAIIVKNVEHTKQWNDHGTAKRSIQAVTIEPKFRWKL